MGEQRRRFAFYETFITNKSSESIQSCEPGLPVGPEVLVKMPKNLEHHPLRGLYSLAGGSVPNERAILNLLVVTVDNSDLKPVKTHVAFI